MKNDAYKRCLSCGWVTTEELDNFCRCCGRVLVMEKAKSVYELLPDATANDMAEPAPNPAEGWECPRCGTIHAMWDMTCGCRPPSTTTTGESFKPSIPSVWKDSTAPPAESTVAWGYVSPATDGQREPTPGLLDGHEERIKALEDHFAVIDGRLNLYSDWLTGHDSKLKALANKVTATDNCLVGLRDSVSAIEQDNSNRRADVLELRAWIGNLDNKITAIEQDISALQHAACETARVVLNEPTNPVGGNISYEYHDDPRHLTVDPATPEGEIHVVSKNGTRYIHRPDEVIHTELIDDRPLTEEEKEYAGTISYAYGDPEPTPPPSPVCQSCGSVLTTDSYGILHCKDEKAGIDSRMTLCAGCWKKATEKEPATIPLPRFNILTDSTMSPDEIHIFSSGEKVVVKVKEADNA